MIELLERVVETCGEEIMRLRGFNQEATDKDDQLGAHFSTKADIVSQELGFSILRDFLPKETVIAEEQENDQSIPDDCTVFDPLDGTTNFFNGLDDFAVTVCTLRSGKPVYGAAYFPVRGKLVSAVCGQGCYVGGFKRGRRINNIPWHGFKDKAQIGTDVGPWAHNQNIFDYVLKPLSRNFGMQSVLSAVEGGRRVLVGHTGAYYNLGIAKIWDAAAIALAIEEAGGIVCDPYGKPLERKTIGCDWVMAVNQEFADAVVEHTCKWTGRWK